MTDYGTIKIPRETYEKHNKRRKAAELEWEEYLNKESVTVTHEIDGMEEIDSFQPLTYDDAKTASKDALREFFEERQR